MLTENEVRSLIFNAAIRSGVSPELIKTRLLNDRDKDDIRRGLITIGALIAHAAVWRDSGMPDYANGKNIPYYIEKHVEEKSPATHTGP